MRSRSCGIDDLFSPRIANMAPIAVDMLRTHRLLFTEELRSGALDESRLRSQAAARTLTRGNGVSPLLQRVAMRARLLTYESHNVAGQRARRNAVLGAQAWGPPRLLVRVDEFPHARAVDQPGRFGTARFARFADIMLDAGVPFLLALVPRPAADYLNPSATYNRAWLADEVQAIERLEPGGIDFGVHGLTHRTRHRNPRRHSELAGLTRAELEALLDRAELELSRSTGQVPTVFVPPFDRFDAPHLEVLASRYEIVTGGPASVRVTGFSDTPAWTGGAAFLPAYPPLYGSAEEIANGIERIAASGAAVWAPAVVHWGREQSGDWRRLRRAATILAKYAVRWSEFIEAVRSITVDASSHG